MKFKLYLRNGFIVVSIAIYLVCLAFLSCEKNEDLNENEFVIETYLKDLQPGVDSVQLISNKHPLYKEAIFSKYFIRSRFSSDKVNSVFCIYYYTNGSAALLLSNINGDKVFAYIFDSKTKKLIEACSANLPIMPDSSLKNSTIDKEFKLVSLTTGKTLFTYSNDKFAGLESKSWGGCMRKAMQRLYDDWDNDPVGTFTCWVTGPLCVVGGGLACGIQSL